MQEAMKSAESQPENDSSLPSDNLIRKVSILGENATAADNSITTTLYTWWSFPTIGLLELLYPWKKFANFYFLCVGIMQMWKDVSLTNGQPSSFMTLSFIVVCEMFFKGKEELQRFRGDRTTNRELVEVLVLDEPAVPARTHGPSSMRGRSASGPGRGGGGGQFAKKPWSEVRVGDLVRVHARETFPADLLLLRGSDPPGQCWVNTKPLDGETDTKLRLAPKKLAELLEAPSACEPARLIEMLRGGHVRCEEPNDKVNDITAQLCLRSDVGLPPLLLSEDNFLLRGCQLRNTDWVSRRDGSEGARIRRVRNLHAYACTYMLSRSLARALPTIRLPPVAYTGRTLSHGLLPASFASLAARCLGWSVRLACRPRSNTTLAPSASACLSLSRPSCGRGWSTPSAARARSPRWAAPPRW